MRNPRLVCLVVLLCLCLGIFVGLLIAPGARPETAALGAAKPGDVVFVTVKDGQVCYAVTKAGKPPKTLRLAECPKSPSDYR